MFGYLRKKEGNKMANPKIKFVFFCVAFAVLDTGCTKVEIPENTGLPSPVINTIEIDNNGIKWITTDKGVVSYDGDKLNYYPEYESFNNGNANRLFSEKDPATNKIWLCSNNGLSVFEHSNNKITSFETYNTNQSGILSDSVITIDIDSEKNSYIATSSGLSVFSNNKWLDYFGQAGNNILRNFKISAVAAAKNNWVYVSTQGGGVSRFKYLDGITGATTFTHEWASGLKSDNILTVVVVDDTCQWYGTDKGAALHINELTKSGWEYYSRTNGLICDTVNTIAKDLSGNIWFGTPKGISKMHDNEWENFTTENGLVSNRINTIAVDLDGSVWVGTDNGISHYVNNAWVNFTWN